MVLCLCLYGGWQLRPVFPCPTLPQACLSVCLHTSLGAAPASEPLPRVSPIHISSQNDFFPLHSICMEKSAYHSPCRCGMGCAGRHSPCLRQITKRGGLWIHKTKSCTSTGTANKPYDTCLNHKQLHPPWTGEASCASYTGRYSDSGIQRGSRLPRA